MDRQKIFIEPDNTKITALFNPFYQEFQDDTDKLFASYSDNEKATIESYLTKALQLANKTIEQWKN